VVRGHAPGLLGPGGKVPGAPPGRTLSRSGAGLPP
jgi:hypothetical protein